MYENQNNKQKCKDQPFNWNKSLFPAAKTTSTAQKRTVNTLHTCHFGSGFTSQYFTQGGSTVNFLVLWKSGWPKFVFLAEGCGFQGDDLCGNVVLYPKRIKLILFL